MKKLIFFGFVVTFCNFSPINNLMAQTISPQAVDSIVTQTMKAFHVPGLVLSIVKDGKIVYARGYGYRSVENQTKVDEQTLFAIASNTKAFTAATLAILNDDKKVDWEDKVRNYIPEFKLYDPYVTEEFTIRDLLTHRSGLGLGAGDFMIFPANDSFTKADIIHNLRYLKPTSSFRTKYDYDNLLYLVAGEVVKRASGMDWETFVEQRIFAPLAMTQSATAYNRLKDTTNIAVPYVWMNEKFIPVGRSRSEVRNSVGGIYANVNELSRWVIAQLNRGTYNGQTIFSSQQSKEMWSPQTIQKAETTPFYRSNFRAYGLGWDLQDVNGFFQVRHTGGLAGMVSQVLMLPDLNAGIIILTNQENALAYITIADMIKDRLIGNGTYDRVALYRGVDEQNSAMAEKQLKEVDSLLKSAEKKVAPIDISGMYADAWFGEVLISKNKANYYFTAKRSPSMKGRMLFLRGNTFVVQWDDRTMNADAYATFTLDERGVPAGFTMKAISPLTDFSYDFQDLSFSKK